MTAVVKYPHMRSEVIEAVRALSDPRYQGTSWGRHEEGVSFYDDFTLNVHILYDDCMVLPDPRVAVPDVLHAGEISAFIELERALGPMIQDLGEKPDGAYTNDPRWRRVVEAAASALLVMQRLDQETSSTGADCE